MALNPERPGELMVLFGTGSFFRSEDRDAANPQIQTLYGVRDSGASVTTSRGDRDDLLQQEITFETTTTALGKSRTVREVSNNDYTAADEPGWYLDLASGAGCPRRARDQSRDLPLLVNAQAGTLYHAAPRCRPLLRWPRRLPFRY